MSYPTPDRDDLTRFRHGYRTALLWCCAVGEAADSVAESPDYFDRMLPAALTAELDRDADAFLTGPAGPLIAAAVEDSGGEYDYGDAGHDLALTRNGHGTGYWDREMLAADVGARLSDLAHAEGERWIDVGTDDGPETWEVI